MNKTISFLLICLCFPFLAQSQITNTTCETAIQLDCSQAKIVYFVNQDIPIWYKIIGTGDIFHTSLCHYSPKVTVFEGNCDTLTEINTQRGLMGYYNYLCENYSSEVGFKTEFGKTYYLRCNTINPHLPAIMNITCDPPAVNNFCETASTFAIGDIVTNKHLSAYPSNFNGCGSEYESLDADTWYRFEGTGEAVFFEDFQPYKTINFKILQGTCTEFECITNLQLYPKKSGIITETGKTYHLQILGVQQEDWTFQLIPFEPPANEECTEAISFELRDTLLIDLEYTSRSFDVCGYAGQAHNIWYQFTGDGNVLDFEVVGNKKFGSFMDLNIIKGDCDTIECQDLTKTDTHRMFQSEAGVNYLLQVKAGSSTSSSRITQQISVNSHPTVPNDNITQAIELFCNDTLTGTLKGALADEGSDFKRRPTVWYKVTGRGDFFTITTNYKKEDIYSNPYIKYYKKRGTSLEYGGNNFSPFFLEKDSIIYISVEGTILQVDFEISQACQPIVENDICLNAKSLSLNDTVATTTTFASKINQDGCYDNTKPGLWYTFEGSGELVDFVFEKQPNGHEFTINKGDCDSLICVERLSEFRHSDINRLRIYFEAGETYYIHVFNKIRDFEARPFRFYFASLVIAENDICTMATPIVCGSIVTDSIDFAVANDTTCIETPIPKKGIWYQLIGNDEYISLNSPDIPYLNSSKGVQFSLFAGPCEGLVCQNESIQTYNQKKVFFAKKDMQYYLLAHYVPNGSIYDKLYNKINFNISCYDKENNNIVENALPISCDFVYQGFAFDATYTPLIECDFARTGVDTWLSIEGNDEYVYGKKNSSFSNSLYIDLVTSIDIYTFNAQDSLVCFGTLRDRIFLPKDNIYYFRISFTEKQKDNPTRNYDFNITFTCAKELPNTTCATATPLNCDDSITINTTHSIKTPIDTKSCGGTTPGDYPAWFLIEGDNSWKNLSLTSLNEIFPSSQIWIYEGDCEALNCLNSNGIFYAEMDKEYYININRKPGEKSLTLTCESTAENDFCEEAIALTYGDTIRGSTNFSTICEKGEHCFNNSTKKDVWYSVIGTGEIVQLQVKSRSSNQKLLDITVFEKQCCNKAATVPSYGNHQNRYFKSIAGRTYLVSITLNTVYSDGNFDLVASNLPLDSVNICHNSIYLADNATKIIDVSKGIPYYSSDPFFTTNPVNWLQLKGSGGIDTITLQSDTKAGFNIHPFVELNGTCQLSGKLSRPSIRSNRKDSLVFTFFTLAGQNYAIAIEEYNPWQTWNKQLSVTLNQAIENSPCQLIAPPVLYAKPNELYSLPLELIGATGYYSISLKDGVHSYVTNSSENGFLNYRPKSSGIKVLEYINGTCKGIGLLPVVIEDTSICQGDCNNNDCCCSPAHFNEQTDGDLSDDSQNPTIIQLSASLDTVTSCQQSTPRDIDYFTFNVPEDQVLSGITLSNYTAASNNKAFIGIQAGISIAATAETPTASELLGGLIYGEEYEGANLLVGMGQLEGSQGFTLPLAAGTYTIWLNQTGEESCASLKFNLSTGANCPEDLFFNNESIATGIYTASNSISTNGMVLIDPNGIVTFKAGKGISLKSGFHAATGTIFKAQSEDCDYNPFDSTLPKKVSVRQALNPTELLVRPNPFHQSTFIEYALKEQQGVRLAVYNSTGQLMKILVNSERQEIGEYSYELGSDNLEVGMYVVVLITAKEQLSKKIILLN